MRMDVPAVGLLEAVKTPPGNNRDVSHNQARALFRPSNSWLYQKWYIKKIYSPIFSFSNINLLGNLKVGEPF